MTVEQRLSELGLTLPRPMQTASLPFELAIVTGDRVILSGHVPTDVDGRVAKPLGKVGGDVTPEQGFDAAKAIALGFMATLKSTIGDLDAVLQWVRVFGMVNAAPGFNALPGVINGCSETILDVFGPEVGCHARSAVGMAVLPFDVPVEIEAEVRLR